MIALENEIVPKPFMFNPLKHHRNFVLSFVADQRHSIDGNLAGMADKLREIGNNLIMDFYTGHLAPSEICAEIKSELIKRSLYEEKSYRKWIGAVAKKYRNIEIKDHSRWTLLLGREKGRYLHIHPARYAKHTIRIKGIPLKTAILVLLTRPSVEGDELLEYVNKVRSEILHESPVGQLKDTKNTVRVLKALYGDGNHLDRE